MVTVADNGCGIAKSVISRIFEPFYTSNDENGTGLGLSIVQGIIHEHGGQITVMSVVGQGTTFTIKLPAWRQKKGDK
jgi:two-component system NtrC family sensor kinase